MNLGDQPAFPVSDTQQCIVPTGMTYRQWLVGQIAGGIAEGYLKTPHQVYKTEGTLYSVTAESSINIADAIIKRLEEEGK